jgi:hypothetical protein
MLPAYRGNFMKRIIFLLTFSIVFTASFVAKADQTVREIGVPTSNIQFEQESMTVTLNGLLPTRCVTSPHPVLSKTNEANVLELTVAGFQSSGMCMSMIGGQYELAFDIRSLKYEIQKLTLNPEASYKIVSADRSFDVTVDFSQAPFNMNFSTENVIGGIFTSDTNGGVAIELLNHEVIPVNSPFIDMENYLGKIVEVQGHLLKTHTPIFPDGRKESSRALLVTGINLTAK